MFERSSIPRRAGSFREGIKHIAFSWPLTLGNELLLRTGFVSECSHVCVYTHHTHREREHTERKWVSICICCEALYPFFAAPLYSPSNHSLCQKALWTFCCPVLMRTQLGGTFNFTIQRCLLNLKMKTQLENLLL